MDAKMNHNLDDLLSVVSAEVDDYKNSTHMITYGKESKIVISPQNVTNFWKNYCNLIYKKEEDDGYYLGETTLDIMPLIQEFIFKFKVETDEDWQPYNENFLTWLCYLYQEILSKYFKSNDDANYIAVVLESKSHWYEELNHHRYLLLKLRIQFPYTKIDAKNKYDVAIRNEMIDLLRKHNIMSKMQRQPIGDWESIMVKNAKNVPIMLYGSTNKKGVPALECTHIWPRIDKDQLYSHDIPDDLPIDEVFSGEQHIHVSNSSLDTAVFSEEVPDDYWYPLYLSLHYFSPILLLHQDKEKEFLSKIEQEMHIFGTNKSKFENHNNELDTAEQILTMIDTSRYTKETFFLEIGKALHATSSGTEEGLNSFIKHAINNIKGDIPYFMMNDVYHSKVEMITEYCRNNYDIFVNNNIDVKTLEWFALKDNKETYTKWHDQWCKTSMNTALSCSHTEVVDALYKFQRLYFAYDITTDKWYVFKNHRWCENPKGTELRKIISNSFKSKFENFRMTLGEKIFNSEDEKFKTEGEVTMKKLTALIAKLKNVTFKNALMIEAREVFGIEKFSALLDNNPELTGVQNGVLEIIGNDVVYRETKPQDYISMVTNVPFHSYFNWEHPLVEKAMTWFGQVFTDPKLLHHFLKFSSSCLKGKNSDKIFPIFAGNGDNSKSMIVKLFVHTFGVYAIKLPITILCEKSANSGNATPQLARAKSTRLAFLDEPEDDTPMNKGAIKRYTGGDSFFARLLNDNGGDIEATFKMILSTNGIPPILGADSAVKKRTHVFPYMSKWVDDPPESEDEQKEKGIFKKDYFFEKKIPVLAPAFLWIMTQYYPNYVLEGLIDPPIVVEHTEQYWKDNDIYSQFAQEHIREMYLDDEKTQRDMTAKATLSEIYTEFKAWYKNSFPGFKIPERPVVKTEFSNRWGRMSSNGWFGIHVQKADEVFHAAEKAKNDDILPLIGK